MALPAQVRKQTEAVNKLYEELNVDNNQQGQQAEAVSEGIEDTGAGRRADSSQDHAPAPKTQERSEGDKTEKTLEQK